MKLRMLIGSSLLLSSYGHSMHSPHRRWERTAYSEDYNRGPSWSTLALGAGCIAAVGYGIYRLCSWAFTKSDQQIVKEAENVLSHARNYVAVDLNPFYQSLVTVLAAGTLQPESIHILEALLYDHAVYHYTNRGVISVQGIPSLLTQLHCQHTQVKERLKTLKNNAASGIQIEQFEVLHQELASTIALFETLKKYLVPHQAYFDLFVKEAELRHVYESELNVVQSYGHDQSSLMVAMRAIILRRAAQRNLLYPYTDYAQQLKSDFNSLTQILKYQKYVYPNRAHGTQDVLGALDLIYNLIVVQDVYMQEKQSKYLASLEEERIRIEKTKAAAAQSHAQATLAQASALQQQAWNQAEHNRIERERNRILEQQNYINALPKTNIHIVTDAV